MKISPYSLKFNAQSLEGILIEEEEAYSLLQPWPHLGDPSLQQHIEDLKTKRALPLTQRALEILAQDKRAKRERRSLVPTRVPPSHVLLLNLDSLENELILGVKTFKIKIGNYFEKDLEFLKKIEDKMSLGAFRLRLDANLKLSPKEADDFFSKLNDKLLCAIDFVEDPICGEVEDWQRFSERYNLRLAHDFAPAHFRDVADIWVLKPSRENPWPWVEKAAHDMRRIVVTTALDHPLGHVVAAAEAAQISEQHPLLIDECGLLSFETLQVETPLLRKGAELDCSQLKEFGFGMDLSRLAWKELE